MDHPMLTETFEPGEVAGADGEGSPFTVPNCTAPHLAGWDTADDDAGTVRGARRFVYHSPSTLASRLTNRAVSSRRSIQ